jgi:hypothetical protein
VWYQLKTTPGGPETLSSHSAALYQTDRHNPVAHRRQHHSNPPLPYVLENPPQHTRKKNTAQNTTPIKRFPNNLPQNLHLHFITFRVLNTNCRQSEV